MKSGDVETEQFQNEFEMQKKEVRSNGKNCACRKLALNQSRQKSAKYMRALCRDNPARYVELEALKAIRKENKVNARRTKERKGKIKYEKEHGPFVLNEITGEMQLLSKVQKKECNKCKGYNTENIGTQVCPFDIGENATSVHVQTGKLLFHERGSCSTREKSINTHLLEDIPALKSAQNTYVNMQVHDTDHTANCKAKLCEVLVMSNLWKYSMMLTVLKIM